MRQPLAVVLAVAGLASMLSTACSDPAGTHRVLHAAGYCELDVEGLALWGCAEDDTLQTAFRAIGPTGNPIRGVVCAGWLKGSTIRLE